RLASARRPLRLSRRRPAAPAATAAAVAPAAWETVLFPAAVAEHGSEHPLSDAVLRATGNAEEVPYPDETTILAGRGLRTAYDGHAILVGSPRLMAEQGYDLGEFETLDTSGETPVLVAVDERLTGALLVTDPIRADAREAVAALYDTGVKRVVMLTGDNPDTAGHVARELGISDVHAGLLPEEKLEHIEALKAEGYVTAMVGDGVNDAPALAAADVGIAMGAAGNDVAIETADIALLRDDLTLLAGAVRRARLTLKNIRENVVVAMVTVAALLVGVLAGEVRMAGGMLVHEASVMVVVLNAMRLLRVKPTPKATPAAQ
ncbi:MAG: heavy metal translocating P-type ATPase, partial [Spirochaetaceae bacterium]